jgi:hypothetical protein
MNGHKIQVAVIGAGPYGLASAAHLRAAGVETAVFGESMAFWQRQMPAGMLLRSSWEASHIADPRKELRLEAFKAATQDEFSEPVPLDRFIAYGQWFQQRAVPDLDPRKVREVSRSGSGFRLRLEDGEVVEAIRVVVAGGISPFATRPEVFDDVPPAMASHSADHNDLSCFAGKSVAVIGGGQSAIESAALLREAGAEVEVIIRAGELRWLRRGAWLRRQPGPMRRLFYPPTDVGPPVLNQLVARPSLFRRFPRSIQDRVAYRCIRPAASGWLFNRTEAMKITTGRSVQGAKANGKGLSISLDDGTSRLIDHAFLATGFRVDISQYEFLAPELTRAVKQINGYPLLPEGFESSVPGLHFVGAPAAFSYGPLMRFVSGTTFTAKVLTNGVIHPPKR